MGVRVWLWGFWLALAFSHVAIGDNSMNHANTRSRTEAAAGNGTIPFFIAGHQTGDGSSFSQCQINVFRRVGDTCEGVTASHCEGDGVLKDLFKKLAQAATETSETCSIGSPIKNGIYAYKTAVSLFSLIKNGKSSPMKNATIYFNVDYATKGKGDIGVVKFDCSGYPNIPVFKIPPKGCTVGSQITYTKSMGEKGKYQGQIVGRKGSEIQVQEFGVPIQEGDSGGGAVSGNNLCGVLSHANGGGNQKQIFYERVSGEAGGFMSRYESLAGT